MKFTVAWLPSASDYLAELWTTDDKRFAAAH